MPCGITVAPYSSPLAIQAPGLLNWWTSSQGDLASWGEPWVLSLLVKLPPARLHANYSNVYTLEGPFLQKHLASEGFRLSLGRVELIFGTSSEQVFTEPIDPTYVQPPVYGRQVSLLTDFAPQTEFAPYGKLLKSTYISTQDSLGSTDTWVYIQLKHTPGDTPLVEVFINNEFLLGSPLSAVSLGALVMSSFVLEPLVISDGLGEINTGLASFWPEVMVSPTPIVPHPIPGYPSHYIGISPTVGFIKLARNSSILTSAPFAQDSSIAEYIQRSGFKFTDNASYIECKVGSPITVSGQADTADNGQCNIWLDKVSGPLLVGVGRIIHGFLNAPITVPELGFGWLRIENRNLGVAGFSYIIRNPLAVTVK